MPRTIAESIVVEDLDQPADRLARKPLDFIHRRMSPFPLLYFAAVQAMKKAGSKIGTGP